MADGSIDDKAQAGIDRLLSMQTPSGGFGIWPGDTEPVLWGTAYVVHLMLDAKDKGYRVPDDALAEAVGWLDRNAERRDGGPKFVGTHPGYVQYVLARAGKPHTAVVAAALAKEAAKPTGPELEGRYLMMAALQAAGDRRYEKQLKALDTSPVEGRRYNDWSYYSDLRRRGMTLAVFHELFGANAAGQPLADLVGRELAARDAHAYTTQELMWGVSGLGKWVSNPGKIPAAKLLVDGKPVAASRDRAAGSGVAWQTSGASLAGTVEVVFDAAPERALSLVVTTEGIKPDALLPTGHQGLRVSRSWRRTDGVPTGLSTMELGELVYIRLEIENLRTERVENVALVDRIPSGWEIENPRLGRGTLPDWAQDEEVWEVDYMDLKDDRFMVFGGLEPRATRVVVYAVRATTAGRFTLPGAWAEAMYDPEIWSRVGPEEGVVVHGPWESFFL